MGSLILCHKKSAKRPYEILRVHKYIYTIEELCYYLSNNLYLIDYTIMNRRLLDWIEDELELKHLADELRKGLDQNMSVEEFVLTILRESAIYSLAEIVKIRSLLERLKNQKDVEKEKYKADSLMKTEEYESAILVYQAILSRARDESIDPSFYGKIYGCLGTAYGSLFLYEEAASMYREAYMICEDPDMLKSYLYCCYRALPEVDYVKMLSGNSVFLSMDSLMKEEIQKAKQEVNLDVTEEQLIEWKRDYRRIDNQR